MDTMSLFVKRKKPFDCNTRGATFEKRYMKKKNEKNPISNIV